MEEILIPRGEVALVYTRQVFIVQRHGPHFTSEHTPEEIKEMDALEYLRSEGLEVAAMKITRIDPFKDEIIAYVREAKSEST
jgi:hypothetical protein